MNNESRSHRERWAELRFSIIGGLLSSPPQKGELRAALEALAERRYRHPTLPDEWTVFGVSTIERWFYQARDAENPIEALTSKVRADAGQTRVMKSALLGELEQQYKAHRKWTYLLHHDNLAALVAERPELGPMSSYPTTRRRMKARGWLKQRRLPRNPTEGQLKAAQRLEKREVRSYEASHVGALWHLDFHHASLKVLAGDGQWQRPIVLGIVDDHSRLCCHLQWYLSETAEDLVHGLSQAIQKRGLPRALMTDNGPAMIAEEVTEGLLRLGIVHEKTLFYSPYQNGKQENFWATLEGRLMEMLEGVPKLTLDFLNEATQAWSEIGYNRTEHREIKSSPVERFAESPDVLRISPSSDALRNAFRLEATRRQRRSDGTISLEGMRWEIPSRYRHFGKVTMRYARWDLRRVDLVDPLSGAILCPIYPLDRSSNADGRRGTLDPNEDQTLDEDGQSGTQPTDSELPPLLKKILEEYSATGMPPAYLPQKPNSKKEGETS